MPRFASGPLSPKKIAGLMLLVALSAFPGCGGDPYLVAEVEGVVLKGDRPLPGVEVRFLPDPEQSTAGPSSLAETDEQGRFRLQYSKPGESQVRDGAVVGWHRVTLGDLRQKPAPQGSEPFPSRIPDQYREIHGTPLRFEIKPGKNQLEPIQIQP